MRELFIVIMEGNDWSKVMFLKFELEGFSFLGFL